MASNLFTSPVPQFFVASTGQPAVSYRLFFYQNNTTTKQNVYTTAAKNVAHANPVVLNASGRPPNDAEIHLLDDTLYTVKLFAPGSDDPPVGTPVWTANDVLGIQKLTATLVGSYIYPFTDAENDAGIAADDIEDYSKRPGSPLRYGAVGDGLIDDTAACRLCIALGLMFVESGYTFLTNTLVPDVQGFQIIGEGGYLKAGSSVVAGGAIIHSMAGGSDATTNQAILDGIYGASAVLVRQSATGTVENWRIRNVNFVSNGNAIYGVWLVGCGRGGVMEGCDFPTFTGGGAIFNGCFGSARIVGNNMHGDGTNGIGIQLGVIGKGVRSATVATNGFHVVANEVRAMQNGIKWDFGDGGSVSDNVLEGHSGTGLTCQSLDGVLISGNYCEDNDSSNMSFGGTNGTDICTGLVVVGNHLHANSGEGNKIRVNAAQDCNFGPNNYGGTRTQLFFIFDDGNTPSLLINGCWFYAPDLDGTYFSNSSKVSTASNWFPHSLDGTLRIPKLRVVGESTLVGAVTAQSTITGSDVITGTNMVATAAAASPGASKVAFGSTTQSTVGAAGAASALPATPSGYLKLYVGSTQFVIPYYAQS